MIHDALSKEVDASLSQPHQRSNVTKYETKSITLSKKERIQKNLRENNNPVKLEDAIPYPTN